MGQSAIRVISIYRCLEALLSHKYYVPQNLYGWTGKVQFRHQAAFLEHSCGVLMWICMFTDTKICIRLPAEGAAVCQGLCQGSASYKTLSLTVWHVAGTTSRCRLSIRGPWTGLLRSSIRSIPTSNPGV